MQYVRSISGSVSKTWNSINPATLSGAIDVIVIEQEDGTLACSPFHVRFGKFSLLRPYEKKVEFCVNGVKQNYAMKLGEGGEAFFVFETASKVPESLQTSPVVSPAASPRHFANESDIPVASLQEPEFLDLSSSRPNSPSKSATEPTVPILREKINSDILATTSQSLDDNQRWLDRSSTPASDILSLPHQTRLRAGTTADLDAARLSPPTSAFNPEKNSPSSQRSQSPPPVSAQEAYSRAVSLSKKLEVSNIPSKVTETGDLMLDMTGYKSSDEDALRAELIARKLLAEELEGHYDIGALIGADEHGNLWIYSSEEAKEAATRRATFNDLPNTHPLTGETISEPGYHSDNEQTMGMHNQRHHRSQSDIQGAYPTPPQTPTGDSVTDDQTRNYAKTLRLTSDQLKALDLKPGANPMSFTVNRATCPATMYLWNYKTPIVISDIDGTITKSDALGHVLNMIGRDWTHIGVAKLYTDIVNNGYNIMYLTSRSTGQADTTRAYLSGIVQEGYKVPKGPVIMSPDRTIAALRREIYLRKPEVFKMACLRDILNLFKGRKNPFYAGFGNRLTDALSYRSVNIPSTRIFTINSNAEVNIDLLSLNKYRSSYVSMRELVDHFFPPVSLLVQEGGEDFTDFRYWRDSPGDLEDFSVTDSDEDNEPEDDNLPSEDGGSDQYDDEDDVHEMGESYISRGSIASGDPAESMLGYESEDEGDVKNRNIPIQNLSLYERRQ
ncbi:nuclear elongation and deformation protein 1 [Uncinocarpus reesii 1704]|uniref:Nuclear elongation and deformation protein 1 n=1 Tax=Uncinocarpus reesii (strain UAMH 1704) TaxID=336963 RepID=C4JY43_UNCRE|nr:nuclear elongation and deformation protein 1 [Uncinocarpus reesii 1704]EEP82229.1 nuclear elongation and deformation protein 1 [Uncinocarpus reesii 1704]